MHTRTYTHTFFTYTTCTRTPTNTNNSAFNIGTETLTEAASSKSSSEELNWVLPDVAFVDMPTAEMFGSCTTGIVHTELPDLICPWIC